MATPVQDPFAQAQNFLSGGLTAAKFPHVGFVFEGTVTGAVVRQQTDYDDGTPLFWKDGSPRMQLIVDVQSTATGITWRGIENTQVSVPNDNGMRALYVKGGLQKALTRALHDAGNAQFEVGAYIKVARIEDGVPEGKKRAPHQYAAEWTPAAQNSHNATNFLAQSSEGPSALAPGPAAAQTLAVYQAPAPAPLQAQTPFGQAVSGAIAADLGQPAAPANPFLTQSSPVPAVAGQPPF